MPSPRIVLPGVAAHITQRGVDRGPTFIADEDFAVYHAALGDAAREAQCSVHAYALMSNHVHLLVTPSEADGLARLMQRLGRRYVRYFNHRYSRTGTLWEGRFRSTLVRSRAHVLACSRYIELNPVRAGLATSAEQYCWTSYRHNAIDALENDAFLVTHPEYDALGADTESRRAAYRSLFDGELDPAEVARLRASLPGRPATGLAFNQAVAVAPRWAALRHHLHPDVQTRAAR